MEEVGRDGQKIFGRVSDLILFVVKFHNESVKAANLQFSQYPWRH